MSGNNRIEPIHFLRGLTICVIVFRHSLSFFDAASLPVSFCAQFVDEFAFNWTVFFVLISGYLFQHLVPGFTTRRYWRAKIRNVIIPYIVVSCVALLLTKFSVISSLPLVGGGGDCLIPWLLHMLLTGGASLPLWYIPMISIVFLLGPVLYRMALRDLTLPAILCLILCIVTTKPWPEQTLLNVVHYLPMYIIGMALRQKEEYLRPLVRQNLWLLILFFFGIMGMSFHSKNSLALFNIADAYLMSVEKVVLFVILLHLLERFTVPRRVMRAFSGIAEISFSIYFIHMLIVVALLRLVSSSWWWPVATGFRSGLASTAVTALFTVVVVFLCACVVVLVRRIAGKYSRLVIGS